MEDAKVFVDTNVFLCLHDRRDAAKRSTAGAWLTALAEQQAACINLQVLNEMSHVLLRRKWFDTPDQVFSVIDSLAELGDSPIGWTEIGGARRLHSSTGYSWWDCLLLASAVQLDCTHFLSEDLQDGHQIAGLTIVDPFAHTPQQILASL
jgi:predicted nucleic acid-binding protein